VITTREGKQSGLRYWYQVGMTSVGESVAQTEGQTLTKVYDTTAPTSIDSCRSLCLVYHNSEEEEEEEEEE
jgi:sorbitol-specific phosphotransferase system component IIA